MRHIFFECFEELAAELAIDVEQSIGSFDLMLARIAGLVVIVGLADFESGRSIVPVNREGVDDVSQLSRESE